MTAASDDGALLARGMSGRTGTMPSSVQGHSGIRAERRAPAAARPERYLTLDAMRGVAAAAVAVYHFRRESAPEAYLAVDFFFALSGFVLTKAYATRLGAGGGVAAFARQRVVRLYPLFFAGIVFGLVWQAARALHSPAGADWPRLAGSAAANLLMLPSPFDATLYPFDYAFWSIGAELAVNLLFAAVLMRSGRWVGVVIVAASGAALVVLIRSPLFANGGVGWATLDLAVARTLFSFTLGCLLATVLRRRAVLPPAFAAPLLLVACLGLLASPGPAAGRAFDLVAIGVGIPCLLSLGALIEPPAIARPAAVLLGDLSYPLYAVHAPIGLIFFYLGWRLSLPAWLLLPAYLVTAAAAALLLWRFWDRPAHRWLAARLDRRRAA